MAGNIMRMAVPMTFAQLINVIYNIVDRIYIGRIDGASTLALTGVGVCFPIITMLSAFADLNSGSQPVLGFNYGAGDYTRVCQGIRFKTIVCCAYTILMWGLLFLFPSFWMRIFNSDPELLSQGIPSLKLYFLGFAFMALQFSGQTTFVALGKAKQSVFFSLLRKIIIVVPLTLILPYVGGLGVNGVFLAEPISNLIGGTACYLTMHYTVYRPLKQKAAKQRG